MVANGDKAKHVWLTELGWSTATTTYGVTEAAQADHLTKAFTELTTYPYVDAAFWHNFRNIWWSPDDPPASMPTTACRALTSPRSRPTPPSRRPPDDCRHRPSSVAGSPRPRAPATIMSGVIRLLRKKCARCGSARDVKVVTYVRPEQRDLKLSEPWCRPCRREKLSFRS